MGTATDKHARGLATDGRLAVTVHGGESAGMLVADESGRLTIAKATEGATAGPHADLAELPLLFFDKTPVSPPQQGAADDRMALGTTPSGRVILARGRFTSDAPLAEALERAGCTRAVALDRGVRGDTLLNRAGRGDPPRARYDDTVLYAIATPMKPRAFRFDPTTAVAQASKR
jgi:hypothetical protein